MRFEVVKSFSRKGGNTLGKHHYHHFWFAEVLRSCFTVPNGQLSFWQLCQVREGVWYPGILPKGSICFCISENIGENPWENPWESFRHSDFMVILRL